MSDELPNIILKLHLLRTNLRHHYVHIECSQPLPTGKLKPFDEQDADGDLIATGSVTIPASDIGLMMLMFWILCDPRLHNVFLTFFHRHLDVRRELEEQTISDTGLRFYLLKHEDHEPEVIIPSSVNEGNFDNESFPVITGYDAFALLIEAGLTNPYLRGLIKQLLETLNHAGELAWYKENKTLKKKSDSIIPISAAS